MRKRILKIAKRVLIATLSLLLLIVVSVLLYMQHPKFGKTPSGKRLERIRQSPNYKNGEFQNISATPTFAEGYTFWGEIRKLLFNKYPDKAPVKPIPSVKSDLLSIPRDKDVLVWFGHSSCYIQLNGKRILIDPALSGNASPLPWGTKAFEGTDRYTVADLPQIDYLLISHDHYDHLDYKTILALKNKTSKVICGLGVGAHFEYWGYSESQILEKDWHEKEVIDSGFTIYTEPARHISGRGFKQNQALWLSFLLQSPDKKIFYSGDGGYDKHFAAIGKQYAPIDLAILENGQYDSAWHYVHMLPGEVLQAGNDLQAKRIIPVHNSKFVLGRHPWYEPLAKITELNKGRIPLVTPRIGEIVYLDDSDQTFEEWWRKI